jgi:menaquinone-dependent protoporphyrinogen oxidase
MAAFDLVERRDECLRLLAGVRASRDTAGMTDLPRVLVAYATAAGSTAGVAERIAEVLRTAGYDVVCQPAAADVDPAGFDALVLGSAVHNMAWLPSALDLLQRAAGSQQVWCFSIGGVNPRGRYTRYVARSEAERVAQRFPASFTPREHRVFGGVVEMEGTPLWGRLVYRLSGARAGDQRDWPAVESWARRIASDLGRAPTPGEPSRADGGTETRRPHSPGPTPRR